MKAGNPLSRDAVDRVMNIRSGEGLAILGASK